MNGRIRVLSLLTRLQDKDEEQMWQSAHRRPAGYGALIPALEQRSNTQLDAPGRTRRRPLAQMCAAPLRAAVRLCDV
jgi:hypothetical protein